MSDINLDFTVSNNSINFTVEPNEITITPTDIQLTINPSYSPGAGGNVGELQYNNGSLLDGIPFTDYDGSNLTLGDVANLKITGGVNGYFLQTDGTGNLGWAAGGGGGGNGSPGGSNTQVQFNDAGVFNGTSNVVYNKTTNILTITNANIANLYSGNITGNANLTTLKLNSSNVSLGASSGNAQGYASIAIGDTAGGSNAQQERAIAIGYHAGQNNQGNYAISIGDFAGGTNQSDAAIAIGGGAGQNNQGDVGIAIGSFAGYDTQGNNAIAIGTEAGNVSQNDYAIAIGYNAGKNNQSNNSIAIGVFAGNNNQGSDSIAIGPRAGANNQANNTIILNATGSNLDAGTANTFVVKPVRNFNTTEVLMYNNVSGEISWDYLSNISISANFANFAGNVTVSSQPNITDLGTLTTLAVNNNVTATRFTSNVATGTAPLTVSSNTVVANLNADLLDGYNSAITATANTVAVRGTNGNLTANFFLGNGSALTGIVATTANFANQAGNLVVANSYTVSNIGVTNNFSAGAANIANIYNTAGLITANRISANVYFTGPTSAGTYASLPSASISAGGRSIINDANTTTFNAIVGGGGSNMMPVFSDGTNWRAG